jgi:NAD(P)-dependent dehydrogenase (short-subunit alcohol dehydrogenase family)
MATEHLTGRVAVVTGGASGLGAAMAHECARAGMHVALLDIDEPRARSVAAELASLGVTAEARRVDTGVAESIRDAAAWVHERLGGCDLLCANVGVQQFGAIDRLTDDDWTWVLTVNVLGTVRTVAAFLPLLRRRGGWRQIAITASSGVFVPAIRLGAYTTSKCALVGYGETLRLELADEGIGVTLVFPAGMMTRHLESSAAARPERLGESVLRPEDVEAMLAASPATAGDIATPEDAARGVLDQLLANEPYVITHGDYRDQITAQRTRVDAAFDRMEQEQARGPTQAGA